jgi:hypothetical protein
MRLARFLLAAPLALAACGDDNIVAPSGHAGRPSAAISDAAHDGTRGFYFLAPIVEQPRSSEFGAFDGSRTVKVSVCTLSAPGTSAAACRDVPRVLDPAVVGVDVHGHHYHTNWRTESFPSGEYYRVIVQEGGAIWGYADVLIGATGRDFRGINRGEFAPLLDGRTLPIKFRIEQGAQPGTGGTGGGTDPGDAT